MSPDQLTRQLKEAISDSHIAGASMAVQIGSERLTASAGIGNWNTQQRVTDDTMFQIGSISKVFTATLLAKLESESALDLSQPVSTILPALEIDGAVVPDSMTVRSLLDYSAGMEGDYFKDFGPAPTALEDYVHSCRSLRYLHSPGEMRAYNSTAYCIAGRVIEILLGEYFNDALAKHLLQPLGIHEYSFFDHEVARYRTAVGHSWNENNQTFDVVSALRLPQCMSPAGASLTMSASSLLDFGLMHLNDGTNRSGAAYMPADAVKKMQTPFRRVPPNDSELLMGWARLDTGNGPMIVASGQAAAQNSFLLIHPNTHSVMSILANVDDGAKSLLYGMGVQIFKDLGGVELALPNANDNEIDLSRNLTKEEAAPLLGQYSNSTILEIGFEDGQLFAQMSAPDAASGEPTTQKSLLAAQSESRFALLDETNETAYAFVDFIQPNSRNVATHIAIAGRLFARIDH